MTCDVCEGHGIYPIHNRFGREVYAITCPDCLGSGAGEAESATGEHSTEARHLNPMEPR